MNKELEKLESYINSLGAKLKNEKFVNNAKADIVDAERARLKTAEEALKKVREQLTMLS